MNVFNFLNTINSKSEYLFNEKVSKKEYSQYVINRGLSHFEKTILLANEVNLRRLTNKQHYDFLFHTIPKGKRKSEWFKFEKNLDFIQQLAEYYETSLSKAEEIISVLRPDQIEGLKILLQKGGK